MKFKKYFYKFIILSFIAIFSLFWFNSNNLTFLVKAEEKITDEVNKKIEEVKLNMYTLQTSVESYATESEWNEVPATLDILKQSALNPKTGTSYWKDFINPFTGKSGISKKGSLMEYKHYKPHPNFKGIVLYEPIGTPITNYNIFGCDEKGKLIKEKGIIFCLTNN